MKKLITFLVLFIFLNFNNVFAEVCLIENETAPFLEKYIENTKKALEKINSEAKKEKNSTKKEINKLWEILIASYNKSFNPDYDFSLMRYRLNIPKNMEMPKEIERDFERLEKNWKEISEELKFLILNWYGDSKIKNFCDEFNNINCKNTIPNNIKVSDLLVKILKNQRNIETTYLKSTMWSNIWDYSLILVEKDFYLNMKKYYSKSSYSKCNKKQKTFYTRVMKSSKEIWNSNNSIENWVKKWREAWNLLMWIDMTKEEQNKIERDLLKQKLEEDWIYGTNQENILNSLDKYNQDSFFSLKNNFITNTFFNIIEEIKKASSQIKKEILSDFISEEKNKNKKVSISSITDSKENMFKTENHYKRINSFYITHSQSSSLSDINSASLRTRLIKTHLYLRDAINILSKDSCRKAVKICNQQDSWRWKCWKCK